MNFGNQIKQLRKEQSLTQEELIDKLNVSRQTISSWETNRNLPDLEMVVRIAKLFSISLDQLILGDTTMTNKLIIEGSEKKLVRYHILNTILNILNFLLLLITVHFLGNGFIATLLWALLFLNFFFYMFTWTNFILSIILFLATFIFL